MSSICQKCGISTKQGLYWDDTQERLVCQKCWDKIFIDFENSICPICKKPNRNHEPEEVIKCYRKIHKKEYNKEE